ncbi:MAG: FAD-binding oxidoreductase [Janthinobacterium lividum]
MDGKLGADDDIDELRRQLIAAGCDVPECGSSSEAEATRLWNGALDRRPTLVARCRTAAHVSAALKAAREAGTSVCIHNGGQDWNGRSVQDDALVLDVSGMSTISIDPNRRQAVIGGGVTSGQLNQAAGEQGLAPVIGNDGSVSMAGLILGGGYGPLMTRFGLACDNLLSAEVVTPDGEIVTCDADHHPDLFWALCGGGGGFGVVTSARVRLHAPESLHIGTVVFSWPDAHTALVRFGELMLRAPAGLFGAAILALGPGGRPAIVISLVWTGEATQGRELVNEIASAGSPVVAKLEPATVSALLAATDGKLAQGLGYEVATRWLEVLTPEVGRALISAFEARPSPLSTIIVHHCHGAATQVAPEATAFGMRRPHFTALIYETWNLAESDEPSRLWAHRTAAAFDSVALPGGYANLLPDGDSRLDKAFGPNGPRLAEIKRRLDPTNALHELPLSTD